MDIEYIKNNYRFETLTPDHDLTGFECDSEDLNEFLKKRCAQTAAGKPESYKTDNLR